MKHFKHFIQENILPLSFFLGSLFFLISMGLTAHYTLQEKKESKIELCQTMEQKTLKQCQQDFKQGKLGR